MFQKKVNCKVCGNRFQLEKEMVYTAEEQRSAIDRLSVPPIHFSAVDCPRCSCQIVLAIRCPRVRGEDEAEVIGNGGE